jgi:hypothetical protein
MRMRCVVAAVAAASAMGGTAVAQTATVTGNWAGTARLVRGGRASFAVTMSITALRPGQPAGTVAYPSSPCRGTIRFSGRTNGGFAFRYRETSSSRRCTGNDTIFVRLQGAQLSWRATSPNGRRVGRGLLRRA